MPRALPQITLQITAPTTPDARACLHSYYAELAAAFAQGFEVGLSADPEVASLSPPLGAFWLAYAGAQPLGCCGLKGTGGAQGEVKRLWVSPAARGQGLAGRFMAECEAEARRLGMTRLRLDTHSALPVAADFYRRHGWHEIARFNDDPYPDLFFEKAL